MVIYNNIIPFKGFVAVNLFSLIFVRKEYKELEEKNPKGFKILLNHENIHTSQQKELLYLGFYVLYLVEFLINLLKYKNFDKAYNNVSFEIEAYKNESKLNYLSERPKFAWRHYDKEK